VRKVTTFFGTLFLLAISQMVLAQHTGHNMGGMGSGHDMGAMKDMQNTMALQATEAQKFQFNTWSQDTEAVKGQLAEVRRATTADKSSAQLEALKAAINKSDNSHHEFLSNLTSEQQAGLKKRLQKLGKASDELNKTVANAAREFGQANSTKRTGELVKVEKAVEKLLREQKGIASQMGIG
jgi:septation ring formation regulator EzrA